jgi:HK97 family phage prohead protease
VPEIEYRSFEVRSVDSETRTFEGVAVPYGKPADIAGVYKETFERGAVELPPSGKTMLYWRHSEPIGLITKADDREGGYHITARISETPRGDEAYTLLRDGVVDQLSVGFEPVEHRMDDETGDITRTKVLLHEVSLVPMGAYGTDATVTDVREATTNTTNTERGDMPENETVTTADLTRVRESVEDMERRLQVLSTRREDEPVVDRRSAGEVLKAIVSGDEATTRSYEEMQRAYAGGTSADSVVQNGWVGDLTRIFDATSGVLSSIFATGPLPATGNSIEYSQLKSNTVTVDKQAAEGDDLGSGKVTLEDKTAPVSTYGGYVTLSNQQVERSTLPVLNHSLNALAQAAGKRAKLELRSAYTTLVAARAALASDAGVVSLGGKLSAATYNNWISAIVDAAGKFDDESLSLDAMIVSSDVFKAIAGFEGDDGRPLLTLDGGVGNNTVGKLNVTALNGSLAGLPVILESGLTGSAASFVNGDAIRVYNSGVVSLQDQNVINLSKDFSVYRYGAIAPEIPAGVVPVKITAEA